MKGYKPQAAHLKKILEAHPERCDLEQQIKVYEFLSDIDESGIYTLFDSGAFNDIIKAYTEIAAEETGLTEEQADSLTRTLGGLIDDTGAKLALKQAGYPTKDI